MLSSTHKVFQSISKTLETTFNLFRFTSSYLWNHKGKVILLGVTLEFYIGNADKCDAVLPVFDFPHKDLLASRYYTEFDIYANVGTLSAAEYYFIGIRSHSAFRFELQNELINLLGNYHSHIYMSGAASGVGAFPCQTLCLTPNFKPLITFNASECLPLTPLDTKFQCEGWEDDAFKSILPSNAILDYEFEQRKAIFFKCMEYNKQYTHQRDELILVKTQVLLNAKANIRQDIPIGSDIWFSKMHIFLDLIHDIYHDCIKDKYAQMRLELKEAKNDIRKKIRYFMIDLIPRVEKHMLTVIDDFDNYIKHHQANYHEISNERRIKHGLIKQIEKSKKDPNKKFFISDANLYLGNSSRQFFPNCNTSRIREDIHRSVTERTFATLIFKR